jgi:hypothetical protein
VLGLCDRFHVLPSQIEREGAGLLRMLTIEAIARGGVEE